MVSFDELKIKEDSPIYMQLIRWVKVGIISEKILDGDEMPSRRAVSALLGVNPNTIQKAYKLLEDEGLILSQKGAKSLIAITNERVKQMKQEQITLEIKGMITSLQGMGIEKQEAYTLLDQLWEDCHENKLS